MVLTDNVLCLIAGTCHPNIGGSRFTPLGMRDINGVIFRMLIYGGTSSGNLNVSAVAFTAQVGKGTTPAQRTDANIEVPFTNGGGDPVDTRQTSLRATYNNSTEKIEMATSIVPINSGTITEVCKFQIVNDATGTDRTVMMSRDVIVAVPFLGGQTINIVHEVTT